MVTRQEAPIPSASISGIPAGIPGAAPDGLITSILESAPPVVPKAVAPKAIQVSQGVATGLLAHKVNPAYPRIAQQAGIQGSVVLQAWISKEGHIENLRVISGHPLLVQSAKDAVRRWRYKPYLLNGEPVQVETQITVNFVLAGR
jgi:protein TonB